MNPLARHGLRVHAGQEYSDPNLQVKPAWLLTVDPNKPQAGSVCYSDKGYTHYASEALVDGGVVVQDRRLFAALIGTGLYRVSQETISQYALTVAGDGPLAWWRLGESALQGNRVALDMMGNGIPNLVINPSFEVDLAGWNTKGSGLAAAAGNQAVLSISNAQYQDGHGSMQISSNANAANQGTIAALPGLVAGVTYTYSGYLMGSAGGEVIVPYVVDPSGTQLFAPSVTLTTGWTQFSYTFTATQSGTGFIAVRTNSASAWTFYLDAVQVTATPNAVAFDIGNGGWDAEYLGMLIVPTAITATVNAVTTGTFAAGTYYWKITALNANGETAVSAEVNATVAAQNTVTLSWTASPLATGYNIYRATATGKENTSPALVATVGAVITYTDTGAPTTTGSGPAINSAMTTAPALGQTGALTLSGDTDTSVLFDGSSQFADAGGVSAGASISPTSGLSLEAWFATTSTVGAEGSTVQGIISNYGGTTLGFILRLVSGKANLWVGGTAFSSPLSYADGNWHHLVGTWDGTTIDIYVDGSQVAAGAYSGPLSYSATNHLQLGTNSANSNFTPGTSMFNGSLDELAVYGYALSAQQVLNHYNAGR